MPYPYPEFHGTLPGELFVVNFISIPEEFRIDKAAAGQAQIVEAAGFEVRFILVSDTEPSGKFGVDRRLQVRLGRGEDIGLLFCGSRHGNARVHDDHLDATA